MKNFKIKEKIEELKQMLLALNALGILDTKTYRLIENHINGLFCKHKLEN